VTGRAGPPFRVLSLRLVHLEPLPATPALPPTRQIASAIVAFDLAKVPVDFLDDIWIGTGPGWDSRWCHRERCWRSGAVATAAVQHRAVDSLWR
jgi:hypothetical protein